MVGFRPSPVRLEVDDGIAWMDAEPGPSAHIECETRWCEGSTSRAGWSEDAEDRCDTDMAEIATTMPRWGAPRPRASTSKRMRAHARPVVGACMCLSSKSVTRRHSWRWSMRGVSGVLYVHPLRASCPVTAAKCQLAKTHARPADVYEIAIYKEAAGCIDESSVESARRVHVRTPDRAHCVMMSATLLSLMWHENEHLWCGYRVWFMPDRAARHANVQRTLTHASPEEYVCGHGSGVNGVGCGVDAPQKLDQLPVRCTGWVLLSVAGSAACYTTIDEVSQYSGWTAASGALVVSTKSGVNSPPPIWNASEGGAEWYGDQDANGAVVEGNPESSVSRELGCVKWVKMKGDRALRSPYLRLCSGC